MDSLANLFRQMVEGEVAAWIIFGYTMLAPLGAGLGIWLFIKTEKERPGSK